MKRASTHLRRSQDLTGELERALVERADTLPSDVNELRHYFAGQLTSPPDHKDAEAITGVSGAGINVPCPSSSTIQIIQIINKNTITAAKEGIVLASGVGGVVLQDNVVCKSTTTDIVDLGSNNQGGGNTCSTVSSWTDQGQTSGCP